MKKEKEWIEKHGVGPVVPEPVIPYKKMTNAQLLMLGNEDFKTMPGYMSLDEMDDLVE